MKISLLIFAFLIVLKPVFPVIEYVADYEYISEVLCINKDKPEMNCNGKCYLMKSLAEAAEKEANQKKENLLKKVDIPLLYTQDLSSDTPLFRIEQKTTQILNVPGLYTFQTTEHIFHPPIA